MIVQKTVERIAGGVRKGIQGPGNSGKLDFKRDVAT